MQKQTESTRIDHDFPFVASDLEDPVVIYDKKTNESVTIEKDEIPQLVKALLNILRGK